MSKYQETLKYLYGLERFGIKLNLSNTISILKYLGNPHKKFPSVHIAGTNGKGSVAAIMQSVISEAGYKTGIYTSPHLTDFRERIRIGQRKIDKEYILDFVSDLKEKIEKNRYTFFEVTTALAFSYFAQKGVDIAVVETGLGGRLDSTNVLSPQLAIITTLSLDHTKILGKTLKKIAFEKAGVIKENVPTIVETDKKEAIDVIRSICRKKKSEFLQVNRHCQWKIKGKNLQGTSFLLNSNSKQYKNLKIGMPGEHQVNNAATAILALEELRKKGWKITDRSIRVGLKNVDWRARFEIFRKKPLVILDVAHNPEGIRTLLKTMDELIPDKKTVFIFGVMADKDYPRMLKQISKKTELILLTRPDYHRSATLKDLEKAIKKVHVEFKLFEKIKDAYLYALKTTSPSDTICITGSHFTVGEFLSLRGTQRRILR
ncbi:MAG: folylpolyglutamate synthase/dihydrofolate synthase family protein [Candidatus Zixiibacteriota bacterium]